MAFEPDRVGSYADDAAQFAGAYGLTPDPWQRLVLESWLGYRADFKWSASRCGLSVPRQNGKNGVLEVRELFGMVGLGERILHTAHEVKTARKAFLRLASFFENEREFPELADLVKEIRKTNGQEAIVLTNGGSVEFVARSKGSARGFTVDVVVMDEAQEMDDDALEALGKTTSAAPLGNPQLIWTGTPPSPQMNSEVFTRIRENALEGSRRRLCWHEWSIEEDDDLDDPQTWAKANPALGYRVSLETLAEDRETYSDAGFARETCGLWSTLKSQRVIPLEWWEAIGQSDLRDGGGEMAIAIDVSPDRDTTTMCSVQMSSEGVPYIEAKDTVNGPPEWVVDRVRTACEKFNVRAVVLDSAGPAGSLIDPLRAAKVEPTVVSTAHVKRACGAFYDAVRTKGFRHRNQAHLNSAVAAGRKRKLEDAWAWSRKDPESDITPLVAATLALWGFTAPDVKKPLRKAGGAMFI